jgi:uncharacterized radical SAM superfamily Fe-S cluster-containing enzyme
MKLLRKTKSLCPEDLKVLDAEIWEIDGQVIMKKHCPEHGDYEDIVWSDYEEYERADRFRDDGNGLLEPRESKVGCPYDCGICQKHRSHTTLLIIDVTNRCNLRCPVCFAAASADEYIYEPTKEQIRAILEYAQEANYPVRVRGVQHSGGEPTVREDLLEIIGIEKELGYDYTLLATNGIRIAQDIDYFKKIRDLDVYLYLQFDGVTPEPYIQMRGRDLWPLKQKLIEDARKIGFNKIVMVPTLAKGINDHQVGDMIRYAAENSDIIKHLVFQPVSFTGRIDLTELREKRITTSDVMRLSEEQTKGEIKKGDFFALSMNHTMAKMITKGGPHVDACVHPHCGVITLISCEKGKLVPVSRFVNNEEFYAKMRRVLELNKSRPRMIWELVTGFLRYVSPKLWYRLLPILTARNNKSYRSMTEDWLPGHWLTVSSMHFMDPYNFDVDRAQSCCLHYGVPDKDSKARLIPFCAMNNIHRLSIEKQFSIPRNRELVTSPEADALASSRPIK